MTTTEGLIYIPTPISNRSEYRGHHNDVSDANFHHASKQESGNEGNGAESTSWGDGGEIEVQSNAPVYIRCAPTFSLEYIER